MKKIVLFSQLMTFLLITQACNKNKQENSQQPPNIIIFYADDLGYGDLSCYGAVGVETPNIDRLAQNGLKFTDSHSSAATCTPSRYSLLTGNYAFRMNAEILSADANQLIPSGSATLASKLKEAGYKTAVVGKWHLGLGGGETNWNEKVVPGPAEVGFDYSFLLPVTGDRVPTIYMENQLGVGLSDDDTLQIVATDDPSQPNPFDNPTGISHPEMLLQKADTQHSGVIVNQISRIGFQTGQEQAWWKDQDFYKVFTEKAIDFVRQNQSEPFFLFFPFHDIHVPRLPNERFVGKSTMGPRGDAIVQMDWMTGEIMEALDQMGLAENTLVIFTSDNGPVLNDGYEDMAVELLGDHKPAGIYRGGKYSIYEAGNRMPTIAWWPNVIKPGESAALWNQVDLMASFGSIVGYELNENEAIDSQDMAEILLGVSNKGREIMLEEGMLAKGIRQDYWKYIQPSELEASEMERIKQIEMGVSDKPQLYNLHEDPGETRNLADNHPEKVKEMEQLLEDIIHSDQ